MATLHPAASSPHLQEPDAAQKGTPADAEKGGNELMSLDPLEDGWETEFFHQQAKKQLERLGQMIVSGNLLEADMSLLDDSFRCSSLRPEKLEIVYEQMPLQVLRPAPTRSATRQQESAAGFAAVLRQMLGSLAQSAELRCEFKVFQVKPAASSVTTTQYVAISGSDSNGMVEQTATWEIEWKRGSTKIPPKMRSIRLLDFEEVRAQTGGGPLFSDCTESVFRLQPEILAGQYGVGIGGWVRWLESYLEVYQFGHNGLAVGDVNGDGLEDLYSCQVGGLPNRLFLQRADGTVRDMSKAAGVDYLDNTRSSLLIDLDNDGDQDLVLALTDRLLLLENDGNAHFQVRAEIRNARHIFSLVAADYDEDGDLDLYGCAYYGDKDMAARLPIPMPMYDANNGGRNRLLRNDGAWQFVDVTQAVGLDANNTRFSFAAVWEDYDNDGDQDLFVANDFGRNNLYRNDRGRFADVTEAVGMVDGAFGMSAASADYNRDGWIDVYKANMFSSAGNRISYQPQFMPRATETHRNRFRHLARGNTLFENQRGQFRDVSAKRGVTLGRWGWGSLFMDFNNDGWEDLFVANGFVSGLRPDDL